MRAVVAGSNTQSATKQIIEGKSLYYPYLPKSEGR